MLAGSRSLGYVNGVPAVSWRKPYIASLPKEKPCPGAASNVYVCTGRQRVGRHFVFAVTLNTPCALNEMASASGTAVAIHFRQVGESEKRCEEIDEISRERGFN